jgi:hypothetical protein
LRFPDGGDLLGVGPLDDIGLQAISSSAGMGPLAGLLAELRKGFDEKVIAMLTVLQAALPHLAGRASVTFVGAISARAEMPGTAGIGAVNAARKGRRRPPHPPGAPSPHPPRDANP